MSDYVPVIGLEIHVELTTKSKMFCSCSAEHFRAAANSNTCPVCLGLPGALPVPNKAAIEACLAIGAALGCRANKTSYFERKNYFYPDLPKGFQLSQYIDPFNVDGELEIEIDQGEKKIGITRAHMEEDTGKIIHGEIDGKKVSMLDFNRSGVPLVEIVSEPEISSGTEARVFLTKLRQIIRHIGVSDCDMEKGHMRLEPNISVGRVGDTKLPNYKVEVKNINSFKFVERAIDYEVERHIAILERGDTPIQETRGWDEVKGETFSQRVKEEAHDYRYFPEPDIPMIRLSDTLLSKARSSIGELPEEMKKRFTREYGLSDYQAEILTRDRETAEFVEDEIENLNRGEVENVSPVDIVNFLINKNLIVSEMKKGDLVRMAVEAKTVDQMDEDELDKVIAEVINDNLRAVNDYKGGAENAIMFLVGAVMRSVEKKIDAKVVVDRLKKQISNE